MNRDEEFEEKEQKYKRKSKRINIIFIISLCLIFFIFIRGYLLLRVENKFNSYVNSYRHSEKDSTFYDTVILKKRLISHPIQTLFNPFKWTEKQISENDELLEKCKKTWEIEEKKSRTEKEIAEKTIDERYLKN